jgi:hypothetical protein
MSREPIIEQLEHVPSATPGRRAQRPFAEKSSDWIKIERA